MSPAEETKKLLEPLNPGNRKKVIFFAVNDNESPRAGGTHWSLLVFSRSEEMFFSFDSMKGLNRTATKKIVDRLKEGLDCPTANFIEPECTQQVNCYDCGIFLLVSVETTADYFTKHGIVRNVPKVDRAVVANKRSDILQLILEMGGNV